jgi:hypothetical protein
VQAGRNVWVLILSWLWAASANPGVKLHLGQGIVSCLRSGEWSGILEIWMPLRGRMRLLFPESDELSDVSLHTSSFARPGSIAKVSCV